MWSFWNIAVVSSLTIAIGNQSNQSTLTVVVTTYENIHTANNGIMTRSLCRRDAVM